jgi:hypothetical protein
MIRSSTAQSDNPWEDLVIALLSVNQYSLERTYPLLEGIRAEKLADMQHLAAWTVPQIEERLKAASCDRGSFMTGLFAQRLHSLGEYIERHNIARCELTLRSGDVRAIETLLLPVNGIGPVVLKKFYLLRGISEPL